MQRAHRDAHADRPIERALRGGPVELAFDPVRRLFAPDPAHVVERLLGLAVAVRAQVSDRLRVAGNAGPHAQHQPALHQVVDHRDLRRRHRRMVVGERKHAGAEGDRRAGIGQVRDEREARCDRLGRVDQVLADERLAIAEPIGEHDRFAVLAEHVRIGAERRVDGLDEESELQRIPACGSPCPSASPAEAQKQKPPPALPTGAWCANYPSVSRRGPPGRRRLRRFAAEQYYFSCSARYHTGGEAVRGRIRPSLLAGSRDTLTDRIRWTWQ